MFMMPEPSVQFSYDRFCKSLRVLPVSLLLIGLCLDVSALAQTKIQPDAPPPITAATVLSSVVNTFESVEEADAAIRDVTKKRREIELRNAQDLQECASRFFTTRCTDSANESRRTELARLRPIEIDANTFKRQARVTDREKNLDEKRLKAGREASSEQRVVQIAEPQPGSATPRAVAATKPKKIKPPSVVDANKLEKNRMVFDQKERDSTDRQKAVADRKTEKERDRLAKGATKDKGSLGSTGILPSN